jgi:hypothetical protein
MRRVYRRERRDAPLDEQDKSARAAGVDTSGDHPPVYTDTLHDCGNHKPLAARLHAVNSLRLADGDELVIHDAAVMGRNHQEIVEGFAAVGLTGCKLIVWTPTPREFVWHPDAAAIAALAAEGTTILRAARGRVAQHKHLGAAPKLIGDVLTAAKSAWADPNLTARAAVDRVFEVTGVKISARLLFSKLGNKSTAEMQILRPPMPKASKPKPKAKTKRRKPARKAKETIYVN